MEAFGGGKAAALPARAGRGHPEGRFEVLPPKDLNRRTCRAVARDPSGEKLRRRLQMTHSP